MLGQAVKIRAFKVASACNAAAGRTYICAVFVEQGIELVTTIAGKQKNPTPLVEIFVHLGRGIIPWFSFYGIDPYYNACRS